MIDKNITNYVTPVKASEIAMGKNQKPKKKKEHFHKNENKS